MRSKRAPAREWWRMGARAALVAALVAAAIATLVAAVGPATAADKCQYGPYGLPPGCSKWEPTLTVTADAATLGAYMTARANLGAGDHPTGTIELKLYPPSDSRCTTPWYTSTIGVNGNGVYESWSGSASGNYPQADVAGTWHWTATYSGDATHAAVATRCGDAPVTVARANGSLYVSGWQAVVGDTMRGWVQLYGYNPQGNVVLRLFGPTDPTCARTPAYTETFTSTGGGGWEIGTGTSSGSRVATRTGRWNWTATYAGDAQNLPASVACGASYVDVQALPRLTITPAQTSATAGATLDASVSLTGGESPTGTLTLSLYRPNDPWAWSPVFSASVTVAGNTSLSTVGNASPRVADMAGTWRWRAVYYGDTLNAPVYTDLGVATVSVANASPTLTLQAFPDTLVVGAGTNVDALLSGGYQPSGWLQFALFEPGSACVGSPFWSGSQYASGPGHYTVWPVTTGRAGTWHWRVSYPGNDANNTAEACVAVGVTKASPTAVLTPLPSTAAIGDRLQASLTLQSGYGATGKATFRLYGPGDVTCLQPVFQEVVDVSSDAAQTAVGYVVPKKLGGRAPEGLWNWTVTYGGDANNETASSLCGAALVTVVKKS